MNVTNPARQRQGKYHFFLAYRKQQCYIRFPCPGGGIGRHARFRFLCSQGCASSSLVPGTIKNKDFQQLLKILFLFSGQTSKLVRNSPHALRTEYTNPSKSFTIEPLAKRLSSPNVSIGDPDFSIFYRMDSRPKSLRE